MRNILFLVALLCVLAINHKAYSQDEVDCDDALEDELLVSPSSDVQKTLNTVAKNFCEQQKDAGNDWTSIKVTDFSRPASRQAGYILGCIDVGCPVYQNREAIAELEKVNPRNVTGLTKQIEDQIKRGCYVSKHLSKRAVDIGTLNKSRCEVKELVKLFESEEYTVDGKKYSPKVINRSHGSGPHLHINFEPYGFDPVKCPVEKVNNSSLDSIINYLKSLFSIGDSNIN